MSGNPLKQHRSIRAIAIFVAAVSLIANVIAIIVFVTGRGSLPALFSISTSNTTPAPISTPAALSNPISSQPSSASPLGAPWVFH